jgi:hypothetical protein
MVSKSQLAVVLFLGWSTLSTAQSGNARFDDPTLQRIPDLAAVAVSPTHLYALSSSEGLVVFRTQSDTLQWLFTSDGMANRGTRLTADSRFAYLFGSDTRLSIIEPTALQGVYSSVYLPSKPRAAVRVGTTLFASTEANQIHGIPLDRPADAERFDTLAIDGFRNEAILDMVLFSRQVVILTGRTLWFMDVIGNRLRVASSERLQQEARRLHDINGILHASTMRGELFEIRSGGTLRRILDVREPIQTAISSGNQWFVRSESGKAWVIMGENRTVLHRPNPESGNHLVMVNGRVWMSHHHLFGRVTVSESTAARPNNIPVKLRPIAAQNVLVPRPLLMTLEVESGTPDNVRYQVRSETATPEVRGKGLVWQPSATQAGRHVIHVTAIAENGSRDSTSFQVTVHTFNQPPRFNPLRPITIPVGEAYQLPILATDPDGVSADLVRYAGFNLPAGATLSERNGLFNWTPDQRQVGIHTFRVVATDAMGMSSETSVQITVRAIATGTP